MKGRQKQVAILASALLGLLLLLVIPSRPSRGPSRPRAAGGPDAAAGEEASPARFNRKVDTKLRPEDVPDIDLGKIAERAPLPGTAERDLFRFVEPPPPPPPKPKPAPPAYIGPGDARFIGAMLPPPPLPPPQPPAIPFQFTGTFGSPRAPIAVIVEGDRLSVVRKGDIIDSRFIIRRVGYESLDVGFVGFPDSETRRLPIKAEKS